MASSHHHRYVVVLALILASIVFDMAAPEGDGSRLIAVTLEAATLCAAVITSRAHPWVVRTTITACIVVVLASIGAELGTEDLGGDAARVVSVLLVALAPPAIISGLVKHFREEQRVTVQTMFGVLCIYLLVGLFFAATFGVVQALSNEAFFTRGPGYSADYLYFSFATLTTVGYGDLIAASNLGRSLAITEALIGQIYLVTVVALIVGNLRQAPSRGNAGS